MTTFYCCSIAAKYRYFCLEYSLIRIFKRSYPFNAKSSLFELFFTFFVKTLMEFSNTSVKFVTIARFFPTFYEFIVTLKKWRITDGIDFKKVISTIKYQTLCLRIPPPFLSNQKCSYWYITWAILKVRFFWKRTKITL